MAEIKKTIPYDFKTQCEERKISQKEVYRTTALCIEKQNRMMEDESADSNTIATLHYLMGFDAPKDIDDYKILNLILTAKYNGVLYMDIAENCGVTYANFKRWERKYYTTNENRFIYECKESILNYIDAMKKLKPTFKYIKGVKLVSKEDLAEGSDVNEGLLAVNMYLNHVSKSDFLRNADFNGVTTKNVINFFDNWYEVITK